MKKNKELKDCYLRVRVTENFRRKITEYCGNYDLSISEFLRLACEEYLCFREVKNNENNSN